MKAISSTVIVNIYQIKSSFICLQVCVSSVDPTLFPAVVETGALMILNLMRETKRLLPSVILSVTVPHTLSLPDQDKLAEQLELEGVDIIQTEEGKCSTPSKAGVLRLIEKAVNIPVMCSSGLSAVTAPMAIIAGATDWMKLWQSDHCVKKSEINSMDRRGGREVAAGTHRGGSITIGEHRKKLNGANKFDDCVMNGAKKLVIERVRDIRVQKGVVLDSPPTNDDDEDIDS
ncbi:hypothetical protein FXO38_04854 [Capsicum annuum]|nr:hypothetical protein FXO38_04854 [Capsicum annuum]